MQNDISNFKAAVSVSPPTEAFMTAASPGVIAHFLLNQISPPGKPIWRSWPM